MPATDQLNDLDFQKVSKLLNVLVDPRSSDDTGLATGQQWFNTSEGRFKGYDGSSVFTLLRLDGDDTITGIFNFNPGSGSVPFTVDATKNSLVTNLNADRVDNYHASKAATVDTLAVRDTGGVLTVATPTADGHAATKAYVDNLAAGQDWKDSCLAATTGNITLSGEQTIDGVSVVTGDRVLVKNQTDASENGLFVADSGAWSRTDDADQDAEVTSGLTVFIEEGTTNGGTGWTLTTSGTIVVGTTDLTFTPTSGGSAYTAGNGLVKVGTVFHFGSDSAYSVGNVPYCDGSDSINFVSAGASGTVLKGNGAASPTFGAVDLTADVTGILPPANGGTGSVALTQFSVPVVGAAGVFTEDTSGFKYGTTYGQLAVDCVIVGDDSSYESSNFGSILAVASGSRFSGEIQLFNSILAGGSSSNTRVIVMSRSAGISTTSSFLGFDLAMDVTSSTLGAGSAHCFDLDLEYSHTVDGSTVAMRGIVLKPNISGASRTVSTYSGVYSYLNIAGSGSVFTNAYHFRADLDTAMATTEYGVYIGGTPGSNTYAFYNDTTAVSYFGGNVRIGTTSAPSAGELYVYTASGNAWTMTESEGTNSKAGAIFKNDAGSWTAGIDGGNSDSFAIDNGTGLATPLFVIDNSGNVGIGTTGPSTNFEIYDSTYENRLRVYLDGGSAHGITAMGANAAHLKIYGGSNATGQDSGIVFKNEETNRDWAIFQKASNGTFNIAHETDTAFLSISNSGNIGVGTTDIEAWGSGFGAIEFPAVSFMYSGSGASGYWSANAYYDGAWKYKSTDEACQYFFGSNGVHRFRVADSGTINTAISWTDALTISNDGHLGVNTSDFEAWHSTYKVIEFAESAIMASTATPDIYYCHNTYYDGAWKYKATDLAAYYSQVNGQHIWKVAASGTVDTAITWTTALTINNDGSLSVSSTTLVDNLNADMLDGQEGSWYQDLANSTGDTDDISEGVTNLFYTDARARAALSSEAATEIAYNSGTGAIGLGTEAARIKSGTIGDNVSTSITFTHSLNTRDVMVQVYRNSSPYDTVLCDIERNSTSQVTLSFNTAPGTNEYAVVVTAANG